MKCSYCGREDTKVIETRESSEATRRRRECLSCSKRFTTYERPDLSTIIVLKKQDKKEPFDREKIKLGMLKACEKRPVVEEKIEKAADAIEKSIRRRGKQEISSKEIGRLVLNKLKRLDNVAYIRFASVYREFSDISSFQSELKKMIKAK